MDIQCVSMTCRIILIFIFLSHFSFSQVNPLNIDIVRGKYGTPHVFAKLEKEKAHVLAWRMKKMILKLFNKPFYRLKAL